MAKYDKEQAASQRDATGALDPTAVVACDSPQLTKAAVTKVRAKMRVERIEPVPGGEAYIHLRPVTSGSPENLEFYKHTPGGACSIGLVSKEVARMFVLNADYYVDFVPA
jgi:hypothetical protein